MKVETIQDADKAAISIRVLATNFVRAYSSKKAERTNDQIWKRPLNGVIKINVDAAFQPETLSGATGAVARDCQGKLIAAANWFLPHINSVDSAETVAIHNGLYLADRIGCNKVHIESDNSFMVVIQNPGEYSGENVATVMECRHLVLNFAKVEFSHCLGEANEAAHLLASNAFSNRSSLFWNLLSLTLFLMLL